MPVSPHLAARDFDRYRGISDVPMTEILLILTGLPPLWLQSVGPCLAVLARSK
jgi:hypothetical protein